VPESLGAKLRVARESKGISIEQLSAITKINPTFLEALENGRWDLLPGRIYLKPFTKLCGEALDLNVNELYEKIDGLSSQESKVHEPVAAQLPLPSKKSVDYKLPIVLTSLLVIIVLIALAVKTKKINFEDLNKEKFIPARGIARKSVTNWERPWERPALDAFFGENQRLRLETTDKVWARVIADYDTVFEGDIPANSGKTFTADSSFHLTLSRNDRAAAYFNGVKIQDIGKSFKKLNNFLIQPFTEDASQPDEDK